LLFWAQLVAPELLYPTKANTKLINQPSVDQDYSHLSRPSLYNAFQEQACQSLHAQYSLRVPSALTGSAQSQPCAHQAFPGTATPPEAGLTIVYTTSTISKTERDAYCMEIRLTLWEHFARLLRGSDPRLPGSMASGQATA